MSVDWLYVETPPPPLRAGALYLREKIENAFLGQNWAYDGVRHVK